MTTYEPTRSGLKRLLADLREGVTYYTATEALHPAGGTETVYREWQFEKRRLLGWCVAGSSRSAEYVLSNEGGIHTNPPAGARPLFDHGHETHTPDPLRAVPEMRQKAGAPR